MTDIKADIRVEHPDIVCTKSVMYDQSSKVMSVSEAGTDPTSRTFYYYIESSDFHRLEEGLRNALLCSTLLISESGFDGVFERFSSRFAVEFLSELERSEILCEAIF